MTIEAIVPVRAGSRRLKDKNLASFGGSTLLEFKISQLKRISAIDSIVVSSDSDKMLELARSNGTKTHVRAPEYADDVFGKSFSETVAHLADECEGDWLIWAPVTAPLINDSTIAEIIAEFPGLLASGYDSVATHTPVHDFLWNGDGPINYKTGKDHKPSQQLDKFSKATFGLMMAPRLDMKKWGYPHGPDVYRYMVGKRESADIDDYLDLVSARSWLDANESVAEILPFDQSRDLS